MSLKTKEQIECKYNYKYVYTPAHFFEFSGSDCCNSICYESPCNTQ